MTFKIGGFAAEYHKENQQEPCIVEPQIMTSPKKSVVQVYFGNGRKLAYYNDQFRLSALSSKAQDIVILQQQLKVCQRWSRERICG